MAAGGGRHEHSKVACSSRWIRTLLIPQTGATLLLLCAALRCEGCSCSNLPPLRRPSLGVGLEQVAQALLHLVHDLQEGRVPAAGHTTSSRPAVSRRWRGADMTLAYHPAWQPRKHSAAHSREPCMAAAAGLL